MKTIKTEYKATWVLITPDDATNILKYNDKNRRQKPNLIDHYAQQLSVGNWVMNGHSIKISESGMLLDGQNRLMAIIKAQKPMPTLLIEGLPISTFSSIDEGSKRTIADTLYVKGVGYSVVKGAVLRIISARNQSKMHTGGAAKLSNSDSLVLWNMHKEEIIYSVSICSQLKKVTLLPVSIYLHMQARKIDKSQADLFFKSLCTGEFLGKRNPIFIVRRKLIENKLLKVNSPIIAYNLIAHAWNLYRDNKEVSFIRGINVSGYIELK